MSKFATWLRAGVLVFLVLIVLSCSGNLSTSTKPDTRSAGQCFREHQGTTVTPNGKIRTETVVEQEGKIVYETEDGKKWRVGYRRRADDTYEYGMPEEVK